MAEIFNYAPEFVSEDDVEVLINYYSLKIRELRESMKEPSSVEHYNHMKDTRYGLMRRRWHLRLHLKNRRR
jgi:hypothetical protein